MKQCVKCGKALPSDKKLPFCDNCAGGIQEGAKKVGAGAVALGAAAFTFIRKDGIRVAKNVASFAKDHAGDIIELVRRP